FLGRTLRRIGSYADAIQAGPAGCFLKTCQITHRLRGYGVILSLGLAFDHASLRMLRFRRAGRRLPPGELAGIAAQSQHSPRRQSFELADQSDIALREETRVG